MTSYTPEQLRKRATQFYGALPDTAAMLSAGADALEVLAGIREWLGRRGVHQEISSVCAGNVLAELDRLTAEAGKE